MIKKLYNWLMSFFSFSAKGNYNIYFPKERLIYYYFDGSGKKRASDPMLLYRKLMEIKPDLIIDLKVAESESKDNIKAQKAIVDKIKVIFGVKSLEEGGLTDIELDDLLDHFLTYTECIKKNLKMSVISSNNSVASPPFSKGDSPILSSLDSGFAGKESSIVEQELSPLA